MVLVSIPEDSEFEVQEDYYKLHILVYSSKQPKIFNENHIFKLLNFQEQITPENVQFNVGDCLYSALLGENRT